ncbi:hypothetical protein B7486_14110 [cyanobacterium TDX16]|nr:hypothetical protein B7486_14110 [cyanobacterium TDX16]
METDTSPQPSAIETLSEPNPRRHHYVPAGYLKGFTKENCRTGHLHVFDFSQGVRINRFSGTPLTQGFTRDLYKSELDEEDDPFFLERAMRIVENPFWEVLDRITRKKNLPKARSEWNALLNFIALQAARVHGVLARMDDGCSQVLLQHLRYLTRSSEVFAREEKRRAAEGAPLSFTYEQLCKWVESIESGDIKIGLNVNWRHIYMVQGMDVLLQQFARRPWRLLLLNDTSPDLICSDRPVVLTSKLKQVSGQWEAWLRRGQITFPLTRRMALISNMAFDNERTQSCAPYTAAAINTRIAARAFRFVYSSSEQFHHAGRGKMVLTTTAIDDLLDARQRVQSKVVEI